MRLLLSHCFLPVSKSPTVALLFMIWSQYYSPRISGSLDYTMNDNSVDVLIKFKLGQYYPDGSSSNVISGGSRLAWPSDFIVCNSLPALSHRKQVFLSFNYMSAPKMPQPLCDIHSVGEWGCICLLLRLVYSEWKQTRTQFFFLRNLSYSMGPLNWILYDPLEAISFWLSLQYKWTLIVCLHHSRAFSFRSWMNRPSKFFFFYRMPLFETGHLLTDYVFVTFEFKIFHRTSIYKLSITTE